MGWNNEDAGESAQLSVEPGSTAAGRWPREPMWRCFLYALEPFTPPTPMAKTLFCGIANPLRSKGKFRQAVAGSGGCLRAKCGGARKENRASWPRS